MQRQYTGTSGKIDNCQLGVFLAYGSARGRALIDRELYLPKSWIADPDRCAAAEIPVDTEFATKPEQGVAMLARVHEAGQLTGWVAADEAYGQNHGFRDWLAVHEVSFVLATRSEDLLTCPDGRRHEAKGLTALAGPAVWERRSAGPQATPVPELIRVAGARWAIEECFQTAKNEAGLDQLPGPRLAGLARPHHPRDARRRLPRSHSRHRTRP